MRWVDGTVTVEDSVASSTSLGGYLLRTTFLPSITTVTLGLIRMRDRSLCLGPVRLITFGPPKMSSTSAAWRSCSRGGVACARLPASQSDITVLAGRHRAGPWADA